MSRCLTIAEVANRLGKTEEEIERFLREGELFALILVKPSLLEGCNELCHEGVMLGGEFELSGYKNIFWGDDGNYDLLTGHLMPPAKEGSEDMGVYLRKLNGDPLQYEKEWIESGKPRSLRYMWRLNAYGHKIYRPGGSLVIRKKDIFLDAAEVKAFEDEIASGNEKTQKKEALQQVIVSPVMAKEPEKKKQKSRSSDDREMAIILARRIHENESNKTRAEVANEIKSHLKKKDLKDDTIRGWIKDLFPDSLKKQGRPKKNNK